MKNKVKIVTALLITALCTTSAYAAENLIKNDSFETEQTVGVFQVGTVGFMKMKTLPIVQQTKCTAVKRHFISTVPLLHRELN